MMNSSQTLIAQSDSKNGRVVVSFGQINTAIPTTFSVKKGDKVFVQIIDHRPIVAGVIGNGDEARDKYLRLIEVLKRKGILTNQDIEEIEEVD